DVSDKDITTRTAVAEGFIAINDAIYERIAAGTIKKGDVLSVAQLAAIMGAKQTTRPSPTNPRQQAGRRGAVCGGIDVVGPGGGGGRPPRERRRARCGRRQVSSALVHSPPR
ncbi:Molybdenum cofactor biosynthesis protein C, partial [human gut metagenome]